MINYEQLQQKIKKLEGPIFVFGASGFIGANIIHDIFSVRISSCSHYISKAF